MGQGPVYTSRLSGRQLLDSEDLAIGRIRDIVILPTAGATIARAKAQAS